MPAAFSRGRSEMIPACTTIPPHQPLLQISSARDWQSGRSGTRLTTTRRLRSSAILWNPAIRCAPYSPVNSHWPARNATSWGLPVRSARAARLRPEPKLLSRSKHSCSRSGRNGGQTRQHARHGCSRDFCLTRNIGYCAVSGPPFGASGLHCMHHLLIVTTLLQGRYRLNHATFAQYARDVDFDEDEREVKPRMDTNVRIQGRETGSCLAPSIRVHSCLFVVQKANAQKHEHARTDEGLLWIIARPCAALGKRLSGSTRPSTWLV